MSIDLAGHAALSALDGIFLLVVVFYFLDKLSAQLRSVSLSLADISAGIQSSEVHGSGIGPALGSVNVNLTRTVDSLRVAATGAERIAGSIVSGGTARRARSR